MKRGRLTTRRGMLGTAVAMCVSVRLSADTTCGSVVCLSQIRFLERFLRKKHFEPQHMSGMVLGRVSCR